MSAGQARKSLWIETLIVSERRIFMLVRLVRACGSKHVSYVRNSVSGQGQARKSLWIETFLCAVYSFQYSVRLVRACGSKQCIV